jgi:hypothetical protein
MCRELVPTADINLVVSLMQLLYSLMDEWRAADASKAPVGFLWNPRFGVASCLSNSLLHLAQPQLFLSAAGTAPPLLRSACVWCDYVGCCVVATGEA